MPQHLRLFPIPLKGRVTGALSVSGALPYHLAGTAYEGRLQINGNVGDCTAWLIEGSLPAGATISVDNTTYEVVVAWPTYQTVPVTEMPNGDFEQGELGWLLGPNWRIDTHPAWPTFNNIAIYDGPGPGYMESVAVPCAPGTSITARGLWGQGPSNKKNVNLWTCLIWRDANRNVLNDLSTVEDNGFHHEEQPWVGNKINDETNGELHWSTVTDTAPDATAYASVRHAMSRRRYQRQVEVYETEWDLPRAIGSADLRDWCITLRVRDAMGRVADWAGCIYENAIFYTSRPYAVLQQEVAGLSVLPQAGAIHDALQSSNSDEAAMLSIIPVGGRLRLPLVSGWAPPESTLLSIIPTGGRLRAPLVNAEAPGESIGITAAPVGGELRTALVTGYSPSESVLLSITPVGGKLE